MKLKQAKPMYVFIITGIRVYIPTVTKSITRVIAGQRQTAVIRGVQIQAQWGKNPTFQIHQINYIF
jgi:hypothetical protein